MLTDDEVIELLADRAAFIRLMQQLAASEWRDHNGHPLQNLVAYREAQERLGLAPAPLPRA